MEKTTLPVTSLTVRDWGLLDYEQALHRQEELAQKRQQGLVEDSLVLVEHPAVVTLGRRGTSADLRVPLTTLDASGVTVREINRGGLATAHEPGQLVAYPIVALKRRDLRWFAETFLGVVVAVLEQYGLQGELKQGEPGVWVNNGKICSFGIAVRKWVSYHGIALNVNNDLQTFNMIVPCGRPQERVTSVAREYGEAVDMTGLKKTFVEEFCRVFAYDCHS